MQLQIEFNKNAAVASFAKKKDVNPFEQGADVEGHPMCGVFPFEVECEVFDLHDHDALLGFVSSRLEDWEEDHDFGTCAGHARGQRRMEIRRLEGSPGGFEVKSRGFYEEEDNAVSEAAKGISAYAGFSALGELLAEVFRQRQEPSVYAFRTKEETVAHVGELLSTLPAFSRTEPATA